MEANPTLASLLRAVESEGADADPLERLSAAFELAERVRGSADELVDHFVQAARASGCSWAEIGSTLGVSKQAAQQGFVTVAPTGEAWPPGLDDGAGAAFASAAGEARALGHYYVGPETCSSPCLRSPMNSPPAPWKRSG